MKTPNLPIESDLRKRASPLAPAAHWRRYAAGKSTWLTYHIRYRHNVPCGKSWSTVASTGSLMLRP